MVAKLGKSNSIHGAVNYIFSKSHNPKIKKRNLHVSTLNMAYHGENKKEYIKIMTEYWKRRKRINTIVQARTLILSFSKKELRAWANDEQTEENEDDILMADAIAREVATKIYGDKRPVLIATQADNKDSLLHCHIIICNIDYDGKAIPKGQYYYKRVHRVSREVASKYIEFDDGKKSKAVRGQGEIRKIKNAEKIRKENPDLPHDEFRNLLIESDDFCIKEDLRYRINKVKKETNNEEDFIKKLREEGIDTVRKTSKKYDDYYLFNFTGCPVPTMLKKYRSRKLGYDFSPDGIQEYWDSLAQPKNDIAKDRQASMQPEPQATLDTINTDDVTIDKAENFAENNPIKEPENVDKDMIRKTLDLSEKQLNKLKKEEEAKSKTQQRADYAQLELTYDKTKHIKRSL